MSAEVIKSYLVSLSAETDMASFTKFEGTMKQTGAFISNFASGALGDFLKFQVAATGAFASVGFSIVGYLEHLAMADQKQRILAMQSGMGVQQYRAMTSALDVMGMSLEDLQRYGTQPMVDQFSTLIHDQERMNAMMPNYEHQMDQVMGVVYQFERLELKLQGFGMLFASDLLKNAGFGDDGIVPQLERLNDWIMGKMPEWSNELSNDVLPVLGELWAILRSMGPVAIGLRDDFTSLVATFEGDDKLEKQVGTWQAFAQAVKEAAHSLAVALTWLEMFEHAETKDVESVIHYGRAADRLAHWDLAGAKKERDAGNAASLEANKDTPTLQDARNAVAAAEQKQNAPTNVLSGFLDKKGVGQPETSMSGFMNTEGQQAAVAEAQRVSKDTGVPANLILGQWEHETAKFTNRGSTELNNLAGIRYPNSTEYRDFRSLDDFGNYYAGLLKSKRYTNAGVLSAKTPEQFAHSLKVGGYYEDTEKNYAAGIARYSQPAITVNVNVGPVTNADPERIAAAVKKGAADAYQLHMANSNGPFGQ